MMVGIPNPNIILSGLFKMKITNKVTGKSVTVLYNPESYTISRSTNYSEKAGLDTNMPSIQFISGSNETLAFDLFIDTFSTGVEVGGSMADKLKFQVNAVAPSLAKQLDARKYANMVYDLMLTNGSAHVPPLLKIEWSSLQFEGHLISCSQQVIKFNERGLPVRLKMHCTFKRYMKPSEIAKMKPNESPDTTKYRLVGQGDSLWAYASKEYGDCGQWREIANANGIVNPRLLETGSTIEVPAI